MCIRDRQHVISKLRDYLARWGLIQFLVTDHSPPFQLHGLDSFLHKNGIRHIKIAPDYAQSNGAAENVVGVVKDKLKIIATGATPEEITACFSLEYRHAKHMTTQKSPAEYVASQS